MERIKTLCVCAAGLLRSPTLAFVLQQEPYNRNTRACGVDPTIALIPLTGDLIEWADEIIFVERKVYKRAKDKFGMMPGKHVILNIPDDYNCFDPILIHKIKDQLGEEGF